ncbi:acyl-CoA synthetase [Rhodococcus sp. H29-C3]|uniref:acyl-CoA synthetase n=1 Tax=Rhodococcus sp. H29-C3 TaxID=3046307 RepID=UPI0024BB095B|nr:acyl-CoA synthetase [Rhodococcus sp. H29-C3]MDJ0359768.1 acyl-CoA synthetase [Rhodococcus sp. H29-C3]
MYPGAYAYTEPDKAAVIEASTGRVVTYAQLERRSVQFAHWLFEQGLRRGDHIAILSVNDATVFELYWGAIRSGLYVTLVNSHLAAEEVAYIVNDSQAAVLIVSAPLAELAESIVDRTPAVQARLAFGGTVPGHLAYAEQMASMSTVPFTDQPRGADMLYSSGTTGRPKGIKPIVANVQVDDPRGTYVTAIMRDRFAFGPESVYMSPAPIYHAGPLRYGTGAQELGGTVVLMDRFDAEKCLAAMEKYRVTHSQWVPTHFIRMLRLPDAVRERFDLSAMRLAIHAAAPCPVEVKQAMIDWWGEIVYEYYSSTESIGGVNISPEEWRRKPGSVGQSGPTSTGIAHICNESGEELPANEVGLVYFERDDYAFEYHNDPVKTAESRNPLNPTWATVGDVGYLDEDQYLFLTDRAKFTIISGGVNIYPQEIENCLSVHPKVFDVAVIGVPNADMGEAVKAVVQLIDGIEPTDAVSGELIEYCRSRIARYKCPTSVTFVDVLPRTDTGKLVKGKIMEVSS